MNYFRYSISMKHIAYLCAGFVLLTASYYADKAGRSLLVQREEQKVGKVIEELYEYYLSHIDQMSNFHVQLAYQEGRDRAVTDYISGMSDEFAIRTFEDVFVPRKWHVL